MKKNLLFICVLLLSTTLFAQTYSGGAGTLADPYQIATKADLKYLSENSGEWAKSFKQTADITFTTSDFETGGDFYNGGSGFIPIGTDYSLYFSGIYDGDNHSITGLKINNTTLANAGLFGATNSAIVSNLKLINVNITGGSTAGGLIGYQINGSVTNCSTSGTISATGSGVFGGGVVGYSAGNLSKSYSTANVTSSSTGNSYAGGFVGFVSSTGTNNYINNCYAKGNVSSSTSSTTTTTKVYSGGFIGRLNSPLSTISKCYAIGSASSTGAVTASYNYTGGFIGLNSTGTLSYCYYESSTTSSSDIANQVEGKTTTEMQTQSTYVGWDFSTVWQIVGTTYPTFSSVLTYIPTVNNNPLVIYPSPVINILNIQSNKAVKSIIFYNLDGKVVVKNTKVNNNSVNVSELTKGIYVLKVTFEDNSSSVTKITKE